MSQEFLEPVAHTSGLDWFMFKFLMKQDSRSWLTVRPSQRELEQGSMGCSAKLISLFSHKHQSSDVFKRPWMTSGSAGTLRLITKLILMEMSRPDAEREEEELETVWNKLRPKMIALKGNFMLSERGLCWCTMVSLFCQCLTSYFKSIAYKLAAEVVGIYILTCSLIKWHNKAQVIKAGKEHSLF